MNETQRQAYLRVMGVESYFPRVPVTAAKPSPVYNLEIPPPPVSRKTSEQPQAEKASAENSYSPVAPKPDKTQSRPASPIAGAIDSGLAIVPARVPAQIPTASPSAMVPTDEVNPLRFRLHYIRISNALSVINEVPYQQQVKAPDAVMSLLLAILQALGENPEAEALKTEQFDWPLESGIAVKGNPALAAQQALLGYIAMRKQRDGFQQLLVFSAQLPTLLFDHKIEVGKSSDQFDQFAASGNYHLTVTHSLQSLLAHPILKRETWAHLQPLRQRLAGLRN